MMKAVGSNAGIEIENASVTGSSREISIATGTTINGHKVCSLKKVLQQNWCKLLWIISSSALIVLSAFALVGVGGLAGLAGLCHLPFSAILIPTHLSTIGNFILIALGGVAIGLNMRFNCKKSSVNPAQGDFSEAVENTPSSTTSAREIHVQDPETQMTPRERLLTPSILRRGFSQGTMPKTPVRAASPANLAMASNSYAGTPITPRDRLLTPSIVRRDFPQGTTPRPLVMATFRASPVNLMASSPSKAVSAFKEPKTPVAASVTKPEVSSPTSVSVPPLAGMTPTGSSSVILDGVPEEVGIVRPIPLRTYSQSRDKKATGALTRVAKPSVTFVSLEPFAAKALKVDTSAAVEELPSPFSSRPTSPSSSPPASPRMGMC